jgi:hypothetical protein
MSILFILLGLLWGLVAPLCGVLPFVNNNLTIIYWLGLLGMGCSYVIGYYEGGNEK